MTIDAGRSSGVIEGMRFWLVGQKGIDFKIRVTEVGERTSVARLREWAQFAPALQKEIVPAVGWRFTSRIPSDRR